MPSGGTLDIVILQRPNLTLKASGLGIHIMTAIPSHTHAETATSTAAKAVNLHQTSAQLSRVYSFHCRVNLATKILATICCNCRTAVPCG